MRMTRAALRLATPVVRSEVVVRPATLVVYSRQGVGVAVLRLG